MSGAVTLYYQKSNKSVFKYIHRSITPCPIFTYSSPGQAAKVALIFLCLDFHAFSSQATGSSFSDHFGSVATYHSNPSNFPSLFNISALFFVLFGGKSFSKSGEHHSGAFSPKSSNS